MAVPSVIPASGESASLLADGECPPKIDLGHLMVYHPVSLDAKGFKTEQETDKTCLELGRAAIQALAEKLFALPFTADKSSHLIELPEPETHLPREKPLPKPRPPTKWEKFAQTKGIVKRKRSKQEWDEDAGEYRRRHGYKRLKDEKDTWVVEAKASDEPGADPFAKMAADKKARVAKQEKQQLQNLKMAAKVGGKGALPRTLQLASRTLPISGGKEKAPKLDKRQLGEAASQVGVSTASIGKFDKKLPGEKPLNNQGKHRKFLPVVSGKGNQGREKQQTLDILNRVIAKNDHDILDINKAVSVYNVQEEGKRAASNKKGGGEKKGGKGKKGQLGVSKGSKGIAKGKKSGGPKKGKR